MAEAKINDLILNMVANPTFQTSDFGAVGLNPTNTSIEDNLEIYKQQPIILDSPLFKDKQENFDENKLKDLYKFGKSLYGNLTADQYIKDLNLSLSRHRDDIHASVERRRWRPEMSVVRMPNPSRQTTGMVTFGITEAPTKSVEELAQSQKVLANPVGVEHGEKPIYQDAPDKGILSKQFWSNFWETRVLAQYDSDGTHVDPITGETVEHKKGDYKLNEEGTYYYENLDGRDVYGKQVLNKMNVITPEDSKWNDYDFFDSDDINQKSFMGTTMKNLALVGSMFLPYVGPVIATVGVATQAAGLFGTLGKMLVGSDSPTLSSIEGWAKSMNRQTAKTDYAKEHEWCWENMIGMIGDVVGQIKEQRVLFQYAPALLKGDFDLLRKGGMTEETMNGLRAKLTDKYTKLSKTRIDKLFMAGDVEEAMKASAELQRIIPFQASAELDAYVKGYQKIGSILSKAYMTGITVGDTYGEAKNQGASDIEATMLTLGYGAAEAALLNTGIGEWLFPELRANKSLERAIAKSLVEVRDDVAKQGLSAMGKKVTQEMTKDSKKEYVKRLFKKGADMCKDLYYANKSVGQMTLENTFANALGEGTEEVTEELLADLSKGCFNLVNWLRGDDTHLATNWRDQNGNWTIGNAINDYALNFVGGLIGGGIGGVDIRTAKQVKNMDFNQAYLELIYRVRNKELLDSFIKTVDKTPLGDKNLSSKVSYDDNRNPYFGLGTKEDNQDLAAKQAVKNMIGTLQDILEGQGLAISDDSFLKTLTDLLKDIRFGYLANSMAASRMLQQFNSLSAQIVKTVMLLNGGDTQKTDAQIRREENQLEVPQQARIEDNRRAQLQTELLKLTKQKEDLLSGKYAHLFIRDALFEMTPALHSAFNGKPSFIQWAEQKEGKTIDQITESRLQELEEDYGKWKDAEGKDQIHDQSEVFFNVMQKVSAMMQLYSQLYEAEAQNPLINALNRFFVKKFDPEYLRSTAYSKGINSETNPDDYISYIQEAQDLEVVNSGFAGTIIAQLGDESIKNNFNSLIEQGRVINSNENLSAEEKNTQLNNINAKIDELLVNTINDNILKIFDPFINQGYINSQIKESLNMVLPGIMSSISQLRSRLGSSDLFLNQNLERLTTPEAVEFWEKYDKYTDLYRTLLLKKIELEQLPSSPIERSFEDFTLQITGERMNLEQLLEYINNLIKDKRENLSDFTFDDAISQRIQEALSLMEVYRASIIGSIVDNGSAQNAFGYSKVINELALKAQTPGYVPLAEISSETGNTFLKDLEILRNKLRYVDELWRINTGQKLNHQKRIGANAAHIFYLKLNNFIINVPDDWTGKDDLQNTLQSLSLLRDFSSPNLNKEERAQLESEKIKMEDAVYDFFQKNSNKLQDEKELAKLFDQKTGSLNLFNDESVLLDETTQQVDDVSFFWWLCSRAAIKSSDFHKIYAKAISLNENIAPIPTQQYATYLNFASIANGNIFTKFHKASRIALNEWWKNATEDEKRNRLQSLGWESDDIDIFVKEDFKDQLFNVLNVPKYDCIVLTEGIPGSGKTTGVFKSTIAMIKEAFGEDHELLKNVAIIHGASSKSAEALIESLGLNSETTKAYSYEEFMQLYFLNWSQKEKDDNGNYKYTQSDYKLNDDNEYESSLTANATQTPPSLIIIDEVTHIPAFDMSAINKLCTLYGVSALAAGDFEQSGVSGTYKLTVNGITYTDKASINRLNFAHGLKLGVSMRTANSLKSKNTKRMQAAVAAYNTDKTKHEVLLSWYEDENTFRGERCFDALDGLLYDDDFVEGSELYETVKKMYDNLEGDEKIGFIYTDESAPSYNLLMNSPFADKIEKYPGTSAQGLEGKYYIVDINQDENGDYEEYLKHLYTAITRSSEGTIIINKVQDEGTVGYFDTITSLNQPDLNSIPEGVSQQAISEYLRDSIEIFTSLTQDANDITFLKRTTLLTTTQPTTQPTVTTTTVTITPAVAAASVTIPATATSATQSGPQPLNTPGGTAPGGNGQPQPTLYNPVRSFFFNGHKVNTTDYTENANGLLIPYDFNRLVFVRADGSKEVRKSSQNVNEPFSNNRTNILVEKGPTGGKTMWIDEIVRIEDSDGNDITEQLRRIITPQPEPLADDSNPMDLFGPDEELEDYIQQLADLGLLIGSKIEFFTGEEWEEFTISKIKRDDNDFSKIGVIFEETPDFLDPIDLFINLFSNREGIRLPGEGIEEPPTNIGYPVAVGGEDPENPTVDTTGGVQSIEEVQIETLDNPLAPHVNPETREEGERFRQKYVSHTSLTYELGIVVDPETGRPKLPQSESAKEIFEKRIDSANGLIHMDEKDGHEIRLCLDYDLILGQIRSIIFGLNTIEDTLKRINRLLHRNGYSTEFNKMQIDYKQSVIAGKNQPTIEGYLSNLDPEYAKYTKSNEEIISYFPSNGDRSGSIRNRAIVARFISDDGTELEVPIWGIPNFLSMLFAKDSEGEFRMPEEIRQCWPEKEENVEEEHPRFLDLVNRFIQNVESQGLTSKYKSLMDLVTLFTHTKGYVVPLAWNESGYKKFRNKIKSFGPQIISSSRGFGYEENGFGVSDPTFVNISKLAARPDLEISPIMISTTGIITDENGNAVGKIKRGHPFVLVTSHAGIIDLVEEYVEQLKDPEREKKVTLVEVIPPRASIDEYWDTLNAIITKLNFKKQNLGDEFTSYNLFSILVEDDQFLPQLQQVMRDLISHSDNIPLLKDLINGIKEDIENIKANANGDEELVRIGVKTYLTSSFDLKYKLLVKLVSMPFIPGAGKLTSVPVYLFLNNIFLSLKYPKNNYATTTRRNNRTQELDPEFVLRYQENITELVRQTLAKTGNDGIYFRASKSISTLQLQGGFMTVNQNYANNRSTFAFTDILGNEREYQVNLRIDPAPFLIEDELFSQISENIIRNRSRDYNRRYRGYKPQTKSNKELELDSKFELLPDSIKLEIRRILGANPLLSESDKNSMITSYLNDNGIFAFLDNGTIMLVPESEYKYGPENIDLVLIPEKAERIYVIKPGETTSSTFEIYYDKQNQRLELREINIQDTVEELPVVLSDEEFNMWKNLLTSSKTPTFDSKPLFGNGSPIPVFKRVNIDSIEQFRESMASIALNDKIAQMLSRVGLDPDLINRLIEIIKSTKDPMQKEEQNSCAISPIILKLK